MNLRQNHVLRRFLSVSLYAVSGVAATLMALSGRACAQTIYGSSGLFVHPTAYTQKPFTVNLGASFLTQDMGKETWQYRPITVSFGATKRIQVGASYVRRTENHVTDDSIGLSAKYLIRPDSASVRKPAISVFGSLLSGTIEQNALGVVASHGFPNGIAKRPTIGHFGIHMVVRGDFEDKDKGDESAFAAFAGGEVLFATHYRAVFEIATKLKFDEKPASSIGIMYSKPKSLNVGIGLVNAGRATGNGFFFGIGYPLGSEKKGKPINMKGYGGPTSIGYSLGSED